MKHDDRRLFRLREWVARSLDAPRPVPDRNDRALEQRLSTIAAMRKMVSLAERGRDQSLPFTAVVVPPDDRMWFTGFDPEMVGSAVAGRADKVGRKSKR